MLKETVEWCKPTRATKYSVGIDLYAKEDYVIEAGCTEIVNLGVCIDKDALMEICLSGLPYGYEDKLNDKVDLFMSSHYLQLEPRSSLRAKGLQAGTGIIDLDFVDQEIKIILHNPQNIKLYNSELVKSVINQKEDHVIKKGDKIAQIMLCEHKSYLLGVESYEERIGGFGSTGN